MKLVKRTENFDSIVNYIIGFKDCPADWEQFNALRGPVLHATSEKDIQRIHNTLLRIAKYRLYRGERKILRKKMIQLSGNLGSKTVYHLLLGGKGVKR